MIVQPCLEKSLRCEAGDQARLGLVLVGADGCDGRQRGTVVGAGGEFAAEFRLQQSSQRGRIGDVVAAQDAPDVGAHRCHCGFEFGGRRREQIGNRSRDGVGELRQVVD